MKPNFSKIKIIVMDFDGVLTDNNVIIDETGKESVICNRSDGLGVEMLMKAGIDSVVISKENSSVVAARCRKLGIECHQPVDNKLQKFNEILKAKKVSPGRAVFMGNDINDVDCIKAAGIGVAPSDAHENVLKAADFVTSHRGGRGAVREICDLILEAGRHDDKKRAI